MIFRAKLELSQDLKLSLGLDKCPRISTSNEIAMAFEMLIDSRQEIMIAGAIDCKCRLIHWAVIAIGSSDRMVVRAGDAFLGAIQSGASGVFLVHNHPSGSLQPSKEDFAFTNIVAEAGIIFGYPLLDHVIVSRKGFRSLMTHLILKSRRNIVPLTVGYVCESSSVIGLQIHWSCPRCKNENIGHWTEGIQSHDSGMSRPVRCASCLSMSWLKGHIGKWKQLPTKSMATSITNAADALKP